MHLKLRAQAKKQIEMIDANIDKLHTLRNSIESAQCVHLLLCHRFRANTLELLACRMNREMMEGMQSGTSALKATQVFVICSFILVCCFIHASTIAGMSTEPQMS